MVRLLHLAPTDADFQTRRAIGQLCAKLGDAYEAESWSFGAAGREIRAPVPLPLRSPLAAARALRRAAFKPADIVHCWGVASLAAAVVSTDARLIFSPIGALSAGQRRWLAAIYAYRPFRGVVPSAMGQRALVGGGLAASAVRMVRPGVDFSLLKRQRDDDLRQSLGLSADDYVLLAAGETTSAAGHADALWAASILHHLDSRFKLLLWGAGNGVGRILSFAEKLDDADVLRVAGLPRSVAPGASRSWAGDRGEHGQSSAVGGKHVMGLKSAPSEPGTAPEFEHLLPAADMILAPARGEIPTLPLAISMAAGLPIVGTATYCVSELLEDRHTALLAPARSPRALAQRILQLKEDAHLQWQLADRAKAEAYDYFSLTRFVAEMREVYETGDPG